MPEPIDYAVQHVVAASGLPTLRREQPIAGAVPAGKPYLTVLIRSEEDQGMPYQVTTDEAAPPPDADKWLKKTATVTQGVLQVDAYGPGAAATLRRLRLRIFEDDIRALSYVDGFIIAAPLGAALDLSILRDTTWEEHVQQDFICRFDRVIERPIEDIQTVETTPDYT